MAGVFMVEERELRVLIVGSGYVAQHLASELRGDDSIQLTYSYRGAEAPWPSVASVAAVRLDLHDAASLADAFWAVAPDVVIHTAAMSSPRACENDFFLAMRTNCPELLLESLYACVPEALLIHFSTDVVHGGSSEPYKDAGQDRRLAKRLIDSAKPRTAYGASKLAFERKLLDWPRCVVLRCSNIVGPPPPIAEQSGPKFAAFLHAALPDKLRLWRDERRSFVDIRQIIRGVRRALELHGRPAPSVSELELQSLVKQACTPSEAEVGDMQARLKHPHVFLHLNAGGPQSISRAELGFLAAEIMLLEKSCVASVARPDDPKTPLVLDLDSSNFSKFLLDGESLPSMRDALIHAFKGL